jgi:hypothetical protein
MAFELKPWLRLDVGLLVPGWRCAVTRRHLGAISAQFEGKGKKKGVRGKRKTPTEPKRCFAVPFSI